MRIVSLLEEYPGIGIEVGDVFRLLADGAIAHFLGPVELFLLETKVVGIVVEAHDVVPHIDQRRVVSRESFGLFLLLIVDVTQHSEHIRHEAWRDELCPDAKPLLQDVRSIGIFLLLGQCHTEIVGIGYLLGMVVKSATADVFHALFIVLLCIVLQQFAECRLVARLHFEHFSHGLADSLLGLLSIDLISGLHDEHLSILLRTGEQSVEGGLEPWCIRRVALYVGDVRPQHQHTELCGGIGEEEQRVAHRIVAVVLPAVAQVVQRGKLKVRVCRLLLSHLVVYLECPYGISGQHVLAAYHYTQVHVVRSVVAKCLQLHEG